MQIPLSLAFCQAKSPLIQWDLPVQTAPERESFKRERLVVCPLCAPVLILSSVPWSRREQVRPMFPWSRKPVSGGNCAGVAQLVEHLICNQRVGGSNPFASSTSNADSEPLETVEKLFGLALGWGFAATAGKSIQSSAVNPQRRRFQVSMPGDFRTGRDAPKRERAKDCRDGHRWPSG